MYFFYVPFAFLMGHNLKGPDIARVMKHALVISVLLLPLVYIQFHSPKDAWINRTYDENLKPEAMTKDITRPAATFSNAGQEAHYLGSLWPMCLLLWLYKKPKTLAHPVFKIIFTGATVLLLFYNGHRLAYLLAASSVLGAIVSSFFLPEKQTLQRTLIVISLISCAGFTFFLTAPESFEAIKYRFVAGEQSPYNSLGTRVTRGFTALAASVQNTTLLGHGIGLGSGGAARYRRILTWELSEDEWACLVDEAGLFGLVYLAYKFWLIFWLSEKAISATKRTQSPLPILLISYTGILLGYAQMTINGTICTLGWFFTGLNIAANNLPPNKTSRSI
jgi:hypothetical protein